MALELTSIDAVRNRRTQKLFIIVDDTLDTRYRLINPQGEVLVLPDTLFEDDPLQVAPSEFSTEFSPEQLVALEEWLKKAALEAERARLRPPPPVEPRREIVRPAKTPNVKRSKAPSQPVRTGVGSAWTAPRLSFYRHKIEPLHMKQSFKVTVDGVGEFVIKKEDFLNEFNDVVMSPSYRSEGLFTYREVPEKALKYLKA